MTNAGKYNKKIKIHNMRLVEDAQGFQVPTIVEPPVWEGYAEVKTTNGLTLIVNNSDFEKAFTRFTIRYPVTAIDRNMLISYNHKTYTIEYLNNVNERNVELEIQAKEVTH